MGNEICDIATLSPLDMATSELLANSDSWADDGAFSCDLIDLAMMQPSLNLFHKAVMKAEQVYGKVIIRDIDKAIEKLHGQPARQFHAVHPWVVPTFCPLGLTGYSEIDKITICLSL